MSNPRTGKVGSAGLDHSSCVTTKYYIYIYIYTERVEYGDYAYIMIMIDDGPGRGGGYQINN